MESNPSAGSNPVVSAKGVSLNKFHPYFCGLKTVPIGRMRIVNEDATYICDNCGEEIVVPIDPSAGSRQEYVEDCPVCCNPNVIHVEIDEGGTASMTNTYTR